MSIIRLGTIVLTLLWVTGNLRGHPTYLGMINPRKTRNFFASLLPSSYSAKKTKKPRVESTNHIGFDFTKKTINASLEGM